MSNDPQTLGTLREKRALLAAVFSVSVCGLIYELLIATLSSYLIGSSVLQFSLCIGTFIGSMGLGSWLSQFVRTNLLRAFVLAEIALGAVGGFSAWAVSGAYNCIGGAYYAVLILVLVSVGALVGLEMPLLTRLLERHGGLRRTLADALSLDYLGALVASILFPLILLPYLGVTRTAFAVGLMNMGVAAATAAAFPRVNRSLLPICAALMLLILAGLGLSDRVSSWFEQHMYRDQIIKTVQTRYQKIVLTKWHGDLRLYLDGSLQFCSEDEYRYHECLVHPILGLVHNCDDILVVGGGDGLAVREVLKHSDVKSVTLIDIDPQMTELCSTYAPIAELNHQAFQDPRVQVIHADAFTYLASVNHKLFGAVIVDLPDPEHDGLSKLYSREFYRLIGKSLGPGGCFVTQATSPYFARKAFWCVDRTIESAGWTTEPYHVYVPSFGDWGFVLAHKAAVGSIMSAKITTPTRYLNAQTLSSLTVFAPDTSKVETAPSTLDRPTITSYYVNGARRWE